MKLRLRRWNGHRLRHGLRSGRAGRGLGSRGSRLLRARSTRSTEPSALMQLRSAISTKLVHCRFSLLHFAVKQANIVWCLSVAVFIANRNLPAAKPSLGLKRKAVRFPDSHTIIPSARTVMQRVFTRGCALRCLFRNEGAIPKFFKRSLGVLSKLPHRSR